MGKQNNHESFPLYILGEGWAYTKTITLNKHNSFKQIIYKNIIIYESMATR